MKSKLEKVKMIILDVDGTMTDGGVYIAEDGSQMKRFNAHDGIAIKQLIKRGIVVGIISHSASTAMIHTRAEMLGIDHCYIGDAPKLEILGGWLQQLDYNLEEICYVGDDINDFDIMEAVGVAICPANAAKEIVGISDYKLSRNGGDACIRECYESLFKPVLDEREA